MRENFIESVAEEPNTELDGHEIIVLADEQPQKIDIIGFDQGKIQELINDSSSYKYCMFQCFVLFVRYSSTYNG